MVSQLANQEGQQSEPKVSKLPLPISDSPLVIDLPDGQKIVVGKMTQGSVIEVATWRGVGRPDSRTSRLMLGLGSGNVNEDSDAPAAQGSSSAQTQKPSAPAKPKGFAGFVAVAKDIIKNWDKINWKATFKALLESQKKKNKKKKKVAVAPSVEGQESPKPTPAIEPRPTVSPVSHDAEIEEWLNKITERASKTSARSSSSTSTAGSRTKSATVTKKAAPKAANTRGKRK